MTNIFNDLIISSPNQNGGLFFLSNKKFTKIDSYGTCGITLDGQYLARGIQPDTFVIYSDPIVEIKRENSAFYDIHDVIFFEDHYYIVSTHTNEIIQFTVAGKEVRRWGFPGEDDSMHINCIAVWNNKIVFSAFGDFKLHRGYKTNSLKAGFVKDLHTGEELISELSQPHSLIPHGKNLILANSETGDLLEYSPGRDVVRVKNLNGYTRGIAIRNDILYIGISKIRNSSDTNKTSATLIAIDLGTFEVIDRVDAPFDEVYSIIPAQQATLIKYYDALFGYALKKEAEKITIEQVNTFKLEFDVQQMEFESRVKNINKEQDDMQRDWNAHRMELEMTIDNIKNEKNDLQNALLEAQRMEYELKLAEVSHNYDVKISSIKEGYGTNISAIREGYDVNLYNVTHEKDQLIVENQRLLAHITDLKLSHERDVLDASRKMLEKESAWLESSAATQRNYDTKISLLETVVSEKKEAMYYQELVLTEAKKTSDLRATQIGLLTEQVAILQGQLSEQELLVEQVTILQGQLSEQELLVEQVTILQGQLSEQELLVEQVTILQGQLSEQELLVEQVTILQGQLSEQELLVEQVTILQGQLSEQELLTEQLKSLHIQYRAIVEQSELLHVKISGLKKENQLLIEKVAQTTDEQHVRHSSAMEKEHAQQCHILELEIAVEAKAQQMNRELKKLNLFHEAEMNKIITSRSWKVTAPLRSIHRNYSALKVISKQLLVNTYRKAPLSIGTRKSLKDFLFKHIPIFFVGSATYQNWKAYRDLQDISIDNLVHTEDQAQVKQDNVAAVEDSVNYHITKDLQLADGKWEWGAYTNTKSAMKKIRKKLSSAEPIIPHLIDIQGSSLEEIASTIILSELEKQPLVSIILPVYNNIKLTLECILSIQQYSGDTISYEIILADDASTDESGDILGRIPNVKYIRNKYNLGFLRNCNNALAHVSGSYIIYLNNDVQVTQGWLEQLYDTFSLYPDAGAVGPKFIYPSGHLQEAGAAFNSDGTSTMIGLNENPLQERFSYTRRVDYVSGACLMLPTFLAKRLGGFSEEFLPCYCEDSDLCLRIEKEGYFIYCNPSAVLIHHLSKTTAAIDDSFKMKCIANNVQKLKSRWSERLQKANQPRVIALYLPQFHPFPENDKWWGAGFTEWTNVAKAKPNFVGHYQPRLPADLGYYDLRLPEIMAKQAEMAKQYGVGGFCFYYYWFDGKRLLERPIEQLLLNKSIDFPFCVCWANENWTRRWDGQEHDVLMAQAHSPEDDKAVILDLIRYFRDERYIKIDGKPLIVVYRVTLFPDFEATAELWRRVCVEEAIGEIYIAMVESFDLVHSKTNPKQFGCDAAIEFPPQGLADQKAPSGEIINAEFAGAVADYKSLAIRYATREKPAYTRFMGAMPGWDNTARRQNNSFCFEDATPGAFQAWLEEILEQTRLQHYGDERVVFINAWNEWAEGAYLEPDKRFGHSYLEAVRNALDANKLLKNSSDC